MTSYLKSPYIALATASSSAAARVTCESSVAALTVAGIAASMPSTNRNARRTDTPFLIVFIKKTSIHNVIIPTIP